MNNDIRLIIADDNATTRAATRALLESSGGQTTVGQTAVYQTTIWEAANGIEAVALAASVQPHVILMDVQMPLLDGIAATQQIKQRWPTIKVIVLTLYATHKKRAMAAGADAFLLKGEAADELLTAVFQ